MLSRPNGRWIRASVAKHLTVTKLKVALVVAVEMEVIPTVAQALEAAAVDTLGVVMEVILRIVIGAAAAVEALLFLQAQHWFRLSQA